MERRTALTGTNDLFSALARKSTPTVESRVACPHCDDTGVEIIVDAEGRTVAAPCKACGRMKKDRVRLLAASSNIPEGALSSGATLHPIAAQYLENLPKVRNSAAWALFIGRTGAGKTTQAALLGANAIKRYQLRVKFYNANDFARRLVATRKRDADFSRVMDEFVDADLAILDDFLKYAPQRTSYSFDEFFEATIEAIWARYDARKPLAITTQRQFAEIAKFDAALAGRIAESCKDRVVAFGANAQNWRLQ